MKETNTNIETSQLHTICSRKCSRKLSYDIGPGMMIFVIKTLNPNTNCNSKVKNQCDSGNKKEIIHCKCHYQGLH